VGLASGDGGLRITDVVPDTAAVRAGLREGDIVRRVDGQEVREPEDFIEQLARRKPGDTIVLLTERNGEEREVHAKLQSRPTGPRIDMQNRMGSELSSRRHGYPVILQHDSVITPNDCGGPLVDLQGHVIAINISRAGRVESWAVPGEVARTVLAQLAGKDDADRRLDELLLAMNKRLAIMPDVARAKWNDGRPIQDARRESALLDHIAEEAVQHKLDAAQVRRLFGAQIEAARLLQQNLFDQWRRDDQGKFTDVPDLVEVLRPRIDKANRELLGAFERCSAELSGAAVRERMQRRAASLLTGPGINDAVRAAALRPLLDR
jgi:chorismate mutase-like protein